MKSIWGARAFFPHKTGLKYAEWRSPASAKGMKPTGGEWGSPRQKIFFNDCRKRVFQAFQMLSGHFEGVGNSKETAGRTGF